MSFYNFLAAQLAFNVSPYHQVRPSEDHARRRRLPISSVARSGGKRIQPAVERNPAMLCSISMQYHDDDMRMCVWRAELRCGPRLLAQPSIRRFRTRLGTNRLPGDLRWSHLRDCVAQHESGCENHDGALPVRFKYLRAGTGLHHYDHSLFLAGIEKVCRDRDNTSGFSLEGSLTCGFSLEGRLTCHSPLPSLSWFRPLFVQAFLRIANGPRGGNTFASSKIF